MRVSPLKTHRTSDLEPLGLGARGAAPDADRLPQSFQVTSTGETLLVNELQRCENTTFHIHAAPFGTRSPHATTPRRTGFFCILSRRPRRECGMGKHVGKLILPMPCASACSAGAATRDSPFTPDSTQVHAGSRSFHTDSTCVKM